MDNNYSALSPNQYKTNLARRLALMVVTDLLPFSIVKGDGFQRFALQQKIVNDVKDLPSDRTLANSALNDLFVIGLQSVKNKIQSAPSVISLQVDMSTTTNGTIPLITVVASFMDDKLSLQNFSLATQLFHRPHTASAITELIHSKLLEYNLSNRKILATGDHGKNVMCSFTKINNSIHYFKCLGHSIHLVLMVDITKDDKWKIVAPVVKKIRKSHGSLVYQLYKLKEVFEKQQRNDIIKYLQECEESLEQFRADEECPIFEYSDQDIQQTLVEEYRNIAQNQEDYGAFKRSNSTRWYSSLDMLESYEKNIGMYFLIYSF